MDSRRLVITALLRSLGVLKSWMDGRMDFVYSWAFRIEDTARGYCVWLQSFLRYPINARRAQCGWMDGCMLCHGLLCADDVASRTNKPHVLYLDIVVVVQILDYVDYSSVSLMDMTWTVCIDFLMLVEMP